MDKVHRQHGSIVLYEEKKDGEQYIRIAYADNPVIAPMLSQEPGISLDGNGNAYIKASDFRLPIFHDRYSPHTYIDYSRLYAGLPKSKREYTFPKLHPDEDTITDRIERLKEWVDQSSLGHLPLPLRIDLFQKIPILSQIFASGQKTSNALFFCRKAKQRSCTSTLLHKQLSV